MSSLLAYLCRSGSFSLAPEPVLESDAFSRVIRTNTIYERRSPSKVASSSALIREEHTGDAPTYDGRNRCVDPPITIFEPVFVRCQATLDQLARLYILSDPDDPGMRVEELLGFNAVLHKGLHTASDTTTDFRTVLDLDPIEVLICGGAYKNEVGLGGSPIE